MLLNLRAVLAIGVAVEVPFGTPDREKLTTLPKSETVRRARRNARACVRHPRRQAYRSSVAIPAIMW